MNNLTITGSSGFVGQNLVHYFIDYNVRLLTRAQLLNPSCDIFNSTSCVIHLAGKAHDLKKTANPDEYYQVNFELTKRLYDAFLKSEATKFIFISSVKAVTDVVEGVLTEETIPNPQTHYGKSKLMAEAYIQSQPLPEGKFYYILRPCMIHGPGNKGNLNLLYQFVKRGVPYPLAAFENRRSFLSVENLCFVIKKIVEKNIPSGVYHVADDVALSTIEVVRILATSLDKKSFFWAIPKTIVKGLACVGDVFRLPINTERLNKMTENFVVSNQRIKAAVGPLPIATAEGLVNTAKSFNS